MHAFVLLFRHTQKKKNLESIQKELHTAEELLEKDKEIYIIQKRLNLALDAAAMGVWEIRGSDRLVFFDERFARMFEIKEASPISSEQFLTRFRAVCQDVYGNENRSDIFSADFTVHAIPAEIRCRLSNGADRFYYNRSTTVYDDTGAPELTAGIMIDMTDSIGKTRELELVSQRLQIALDASGSGIWMIKDDMFHFDETVARMLHITASSPVHKLEFIEHLKTVTASEVDGEQLLRFLTSDTAVRPSVRSRRKKYVYKNGEIAWYDNYAKDCYDKNGNIDCSIGMIMDMTENEMQKEQELAALSRLLDSMEGYIFISDKDTDEIIYANDKLKAFYGITDDIIGKPCWEVIRSCGARCDFCRKEKLRGIDGEPVVYKECRDNGVWVMHIDRLINWQDGKIVHLQTGIDISGIIKAENEVQERLHQQMLMSEIASDFISGENIDEKIKNALEKAGEFIKCDLIRYMPYNASAGTLEVKAYSCRLSDFNEKDCMTPPPVTSGGLFNTSFIEAEKPYATACGDFMRNSETAAALGVMSVLVIPITVKDETAGFLEFNRRLDMSDWIESEINLGKFFASIFSGVLTRQRIESDLIRLTTVVEGAPEIVAFITPDGKFKSFNRALTEITGCTGDELFERGLNALHDDDTVEHIMKVILPRALDKDTSTSLIPVKTKYGETRLFDFSSFPVKDEQGTSIGIIGTDFTEQKRLERELTEAVRAAQSANSAKSRFLFNMSHEMRTPMNAITGLITRLRRMPLNDEIDACLADMEVSSNHMLDIVTDVLDMSKIETGEFNLQCEPFDIRDAVTDAVSIIRSQLDEKDQMCRVYLDEAIDFEIEGDKNQLARAVLQLLQNAGKFSDSGCAVDVSLKMTGRNENEAFFAISVEDRGCGIEPGLFDEIFKPFFQVDASITKKHMGLGLGLTIAKNIAEKMNGKISATSVLGSGSIFTIELGAKIAPRPQTGKNEEGPPDLAGRRILLVEDMPINAQIVEFMLEDTGAKITHAENGKIAVDMFCENPQAFDFVFMDIQMPEMDGYTAARFIRSSETQNAKTVPIYAMTANAFEDDIEESLASGMNGHISKPVDAKLVYAALRKHLCG